MARKDRIEAVLATEKPNLQTWIESEDARLEAERATELRVLDRAYELAERAPEGEFERELVGFALEVVTEHARLDVAADATTAKRMKARTTPKRPKDPNVRFRDEIAALWFWWSSQAEVRAGDFERTRARIALGASIQTSTKNAEPPSDPFLRAVVRAARAAGPDIDLVVWAHVEFATPAQRTLRDAEGTRNNALPAYVGRALLGYSDEERDVDTRDRYATYAKWVAAGRKRKVGEETIDVPWSTPVEAPRAAASAMAIAKAVRDGTGSLPRGSELHASTELRWEHLLAERLGMNVSGALGPIDLRKDPSEHTDCRMTWLEASAREVRERYSAARRAFRDALRAIEFDCPCTLERREREKRGDRRPLPPCKHQRFVIAAAPAKELDADARAAGHVAIACCGGIRVVGGVRQPCEVVEVEGPVRRHPSEAWARCEVCEAPTVPAMAERRVG